jgi:inner membrane protein
MYFLPEQLAVSGSVVPEIRKRGIYEANVYVTTLQVRGRFGPLDWTGSGVAPDRINWPGARLVMGITDPRAIRSAVHVRWNGATLVFGPGKGQSPHVTNGISVPLADLKDAPRDTDFEFTIHLAGSSALRFSPYGRETDVSLTSSWPHPSFVGAYLPVKRTVGAEGFSADWKVLDLGRGYPQRFSNRLDLGKGMEEQQFGVSLMSVVDHYVLTDRAVKYGILFVFTTILAFFLFELLSYLRVHPIQNR